MGEEGAWFNKYPNYDLKNKKKNLVNGRQGTLPCHSFPRTYGMKSYSTFSFPMQMYNKNTLQQII